jgi:hypothetical protein
MSRVVSVPIFYATEAGIIYHPVSEEGESCNHAAEESRVRLANILRNRKKAQEPELEPAVGAEDEDENPVRDTAAVADNDRQSHGTELAIRRIELNQLQKKGTDASDRDQDKMNRLLSRMQVQSKGNSKAIASQFVHKEKPADNAAARAIVHHTGSHYVMAGSKQFQKGLRIKGVVSRHSKQGAKLQAARTSARNASGAREDARGERAEGGKSEGKSKKKTKKKTQA